MPWDRWRFKPGVGGMVELARESRGLTRDQLAGAVARLGVNTVRRLLETSTRLADRQAARRVDDAAIADALARCTARRVAKIEDTPGEPYVVELAALAVALHYPLPFFRQPNPERPPWTVHIAFAEGVERGRDYDLCVACGFLADYLCDYPLGGGKTCDAPLCDEHAIKQGMETDDLHFCRAHAVIAAGLVNAPKEGESWA